jgi:hypothetical protein
VRNIRDQDSSFRRIPGTCGYTVRVRYEKAFNFSSRLRGINSSIKTLSNELPNYACRKYMECELGLLSSKGARRQARRAYGHAAAVFVDVRGPELVLPFGIGFGVDLGWMIVVDPLGRAPSPHLVARLRYSSQLILCSVSSGQPVQRFGDRMIFRWS